MKTEPSCGSVSVGENVYCSLTFYCLTDTHHLCSLWHTTASLEDNQRSVAAALCPETGQWLPSLLTWCARDWKTDFAPYLQGAVTKIPLSGSLQCKTHLWKTDNLIGVFGVRLSLSRVLASEFPFSAACGRLGPVSRSTVLGDWH